MKRIPPFIQEVATAVGFEGKVHKRKMDGVRDYVIHLEPPLRAVFGDPEVLRARGLAEGYHTLRFRHIHEWGDAWLCFLEEYGRCYAQSTWDEDSEEHQPDSPKEAYQELLLNLGELVQIRSSTLGDLKGATCPQK